jgi:hypothetical protein
VEEQAVNATTVTLRLNFSYLRGEALERFRGILRHAILRHALQDVSVLRLRFLEGAVRTRHPRKMRP